MRTMPTPAPAWQVSHWFNTAKPISLESLRGRVVLLHTFQMLCPGCVSHGLPQALRVHERFAQDDVAVIGLHTVFEHHEVMGAQALRVFLDEYRIPFPVGIDQAGPSGPVPLTMQAYGLRGTPSVVVFDAAARVRLSRLGPIDDLQLGAVIGQLLAERPVQTLDSGHAATVEPGEAPACVDGVCGLAR